MIIGQLCGVDIVSRFAQVDCPVHIHVSTQVHGHHAFCGPASSDPISCSEPKMAASIIIMRLTVPIDSHTGSLTRRKRLETVRILMGASESS
jgi:hypothetical protein